jgi:hypothetical protein
MPDTEGGDLMEAARLWLQDNLGTRDDIVQRFQADPRMDGAALPDAVLADPTLLVDLTKQLVCEAVQNAPEGVAEELLAALRRMAAGVENLSPYIRQIFTDLQGLRDSSELEPVIRAALDTADETDRTKLERMIEVIERSEAMAAGNEGILTEAPGFSPVDCVACCVLGCTFCFELCPVCCAVGCVVCG